MNATEYFNAVLEDLPGSTPAVKKKNELHTRIRTCFPERDCCVMVTPVDSPTQL